jgi:hypothetical protein
MQTKIFPFGKKGIEMTANTIVVFALVLIVFVVMVFIFRTQIGKEADIIGEQLDSFGDCDDDGIRNFLDKCPCDKFEEGNENPEANGCPAGTPATECNENEIKACK